MGNHILLAFDNLLYNTLPDQSWVQMPLMNQKLVRSESINPKCIQGLEWEVAPVQRYYGIHLANDRSRQHVSILRRIGHNGSHALVSRDRSLRECGLHTCDSISSLFRSEVEARTAEGPLQFGEDFVGPFGPVHRRIFCEFQEQITERNRDECTGVEYG